MATTDNGRRAELGRRFDQGLHGHAAGDREAWIENRLASEGGAAALLNDDAPGALPAIPRSDASRPSLEETR